MAALPTYRVQAAWGADPSTDPATWVWTDIPGGTTGHVRAEKGIQISRGGSPNSDSAEPATLSLGLNNPDGRYTPENANSIYWPDVELNLPLRVYATVGGIEYLRGTFFVDSWLPQWDDTMEIAWVDITATGLIARASQGEAPVRSTLYKEITNPANTTLQYYWPAEDGPTATSLAEYRGGPALQFLGIAPALQSAGPTGSGKLPKFDSSAEGTGLVVDVPPYPATGLWRVSWLFNMPQAPAGAEPVMQVHSDGTIQAWRWTLFPSGGTDSITVEGWNTDGVKIVDVAATFQVATLVEPYGRDLYCEFTTWQTGGNISWQYVIIDAVTGVSTLRSSSVPGTHGQVRKLVVPIGYDHTNMIFGHLSLHNGSGTINRPAINGNIGQTAVDRMIAACSEVDVPFGYEGTAADTQTMGARPIAALMPVITEAADADGGILFDGKDPQLRYRTRSSMYNQATALTLDMAAGHLAPPFAPVYDDQGRRNSVTVSRTGGSSGTIVDELGRLGTKRIGIRDDSKTLNVDTDAALIHQAGWRVHLGTVRGYRYSSVSAHLADKQALVPAWTALDIGDRITLTNVDDATGAAPGDVDLLVEGYTETLNHSVWDVTANCSRYEPWRVFTIGDNAQGRLDTAGSELYGAATSSATSIKVVTTSGVKWTTTAAFPADFTNLYADLNGEKVKVTAISDAAASFVGVGTAAGGDNSSLAPALPAGLAAGDLLLVLAGTRNDATGSVNTPTGYTLLRTLNAGTASLFGKYAAAGETAPVVTFSGGSAGDSTGAQTAAFRNVTLDVLASNEGSNGTIQNINTPTLDIPIDNTLVIEFGWKQDDFTSVAPLASRTEIGEISVTAGNDMGMVWDYYFQGAAAPFTGSTFVVTGGAAAIGRSGIVSLRTDVQTFTVTRNQNGVSKAHALGAPISVWRPSALAL